MAVTTVEPKTQLAAAVRLVREYRHSATCVCSEYRDLSGEGFCTARQATWNRAIDRLIDEVLRTQACIESVRDINEEPA